MDSASSATPAASTSKLDDSAAGRLKALQDQIAARKRKREIEIVEPVSNIKGKGKAVSFNELAAGPALQTSTTSDVATSATSILKPGRASQEDAFKDAKATVPKEPGKEKTVAKKRYLKAKLNRRKANKRAEKGAAGSEAGDVSTHAGGDVDEAKQAAEERKAIKRAKREERNAKRIAVLGPEGESTATAIPDAQEESIDHAAISAAQELRKAERKARKEVKRATALAPEDGMDIDAPISTQPGEEAPTRKERKQQALLEELKAVQETANKKAAKAARKAKFKAEALGIGSIENEEEKDLPPTQPDALPRFPAPQKPAAPDQRELDDMAISAELKDAIVLDQTKSTSLVAYQETASSSSTKLSEKSIARLGEMQIENLFAVQAAVLPILLEDRQLYSPLKPPRDVCVSAPTGSGKTLGYVIPIVEILSKRVVTRLRALIVLPTRDLVMQVRDVFEQFSRGTSLKIGTATGQHSFTHEQSTLIEDSDSTLFGGSSKVDILIVTPGRLMDHLKSTPNFTLQHLRFLVIDEADRLLNQSFNDWLKTVLSHIEMTVSSARLDDGLSSSMDDEHGVDSLRADAVAPALMAQSFPSPATDLDVKLLPSTQKLLFSATLTRDPARVAALHLNKPIYLAVTERRAPLASIDISEATLIDDPTNGLLDAERKFSLPSTLKESMIVTKSFSKPLVLFHLLHTLSITKVLCFTKSVESAARLVQLVGFFEDEYRKTQMAGETPILQVANYSSDLSPAKRKEVIERFVKGDIQMLVCSDLIARGMDIQGVEHVVNYDVPIEMRKYVHRVGRTARAGKEGEAWSLVETQEANHFKGLMKSAGRYEKVRKIKVREADLEQFNESYEAALNRLRDVYTRE